MPMQDAKAPGSMNSQENRVDEKAFSKELERKEEIPGVKKLPEKQLKAKEERSEKSEVKEITSLEKEVTKDSGNKSESGESKLEKKQASKEERLKKFMDSLESEFQVPPTRIVEAFSELSPEELSLPADQSIDRVVEKLDLNPEDVPKVKDLYGELVKDLDTLDTKQTEANFGMTPNVAAIGLTRERFDKVKNQRMALQKSLDQMNQSFWQPQVTQQIATPVQSDLIAKAQTAVRGRSGLDSYRNISADSSLMGLSPKDLIMDQNREFIYDPQTGEIFNPDPNAISALKDERSFDAKDAAMLGAAAAIGAAKMKADSSKFEELAPLNGGYGAEAAKAMPMAPKSGQLANLESIATAPTDVSGAMLAKLANGSSSSGGSSDFFSKGGGSESHKPQVFAKKTDGDEMKAMMAASLGAGVELKDTSLNSNPITAPLSKTEITPEIADRNVQNVMQQAQYLVKNGGGEMKVKMTPEGLGEIQLSVELKDGKVQLHLAAENKETKKMLESSVSDLRESLSQQKISLDSVKIDSVVRTNVENQASGSNHFGQNQNQNMNQENRDTRQFWNQFQEQFGGRSQREALFEPPKAKGYAPKKSTTLAPAAEVSTASRSNGKSSSLNLVA